MAFVKAKREQVWLKVLLSGASGSGKSYSALKLATGIYNECGGPGIAYIGTEGSRNKYYADEFEYSLLELTEPFESEKYIEAIEEAVNEGFKIVILDSMTHEWKWLNDVHDKMPGNSFTNWGKLKPRHNKMMEYILNAPIHVIATSRAKDDWVLEDKNGKQVPKKVGMGAQQDKDITYEYTVSLLLEQDTHIASADKDNTHIFDGKYDKLTEKHGKLLYEWANKGETPAPKPQPEEYKRATESSDDILKEVKKEIIQMCTELGGSKNADLMATLKEYVASGNPNAIKSVDVARQCLTAIKGIKPLS